VTEKLDMFLPYELPPGEYRLVLGLYDPQDGTRFAATLPDGTRLPYDEIELGRIEVVAR
jgi:hypothetical protein